MQKLFQTRFIFRMRVIRIICFVESSYEKPDSSPDCLFYSHHKEHKLLTNRTPSTPELDVGVEFAKMLLELVPNMQIVAIGQKAADTLSRYGIACKAVRHPSMGGAETFRAQVAELFKKQQK